MEGGEKYNVGKGEGEGGLMCCRATVLIPLAPEGINTWKGTSGGVSCSCQTGIAYIMYTAVTATVRFTTANTADAPRLVCVQHNATGLGDWRIIADTNRLNHEVFVPTSTDLLVAVVDLDNHVSEPILTTVQGGKFNGVARGYVEGNVDFTYGSCSASVVIVGLSADGDARMMVSADTINLRDLPKLLGELDAHYTIDSFRPDGGLSNK